VSIELRVFLLPVTVVAVVTVAEQVQQLILLRRRRLQLLDGGKLGELREVEDLRVTGDLRDEASQRAALHLFGELSEALDLLLHLITTITGECEPI